MAAYLAAIFVASLLGSLHCAGMCGSLVAVAVTPVAAPPGAGSAPLVALARLHAAYHAGRLLAYAALGALAGALGQVVQRGGALAGYQHAAALVAGSLLIALALAGLLHAVGVRGLSWGLGPLLTRLLARAHRVAAAWPQALRSGAIGALSALLPCGWLYMFVLAAAGTGGALAGMLVMVAFWAGSAPVLVGVGVGAQTVRQALGRHVPVLMSLVLLALGVWTVWGRATLPTFEPPGRLPVAPAGAVVPADAAAELPPCCRDHGS
jgi:uncharacterized protein